VPDDGVGGHCHGGRRGRHAPRLQCACGEAPATLDDFSRQSGEQIVYLIENVRGERTRAVRGRLAPQAALERMLDGTALTVHRDPTSGAMIVSRHAPLSGTAAGRTPAVGRWPRRPRPPPTT